jgi:hypothetical protein
MSGLILVFDLDQTLIDSTDMLQLLNEELKKPNSELDADRIITGKINMTLINTVLIPAVKLRDTGRGVDAIFMLTNNSDRDYIGLICLYLSRLVQSVGRFSNVKNGPMGNSQYPSINTVFDYVMVRQHPSREQVYNPPKSLSDVEYMMKALNLPDRGRADVAKRTFFFDDNENHTIRRQLDIYGYPGHYILIRGPDYVDNVNRGYIAGKPDLTDYSYIDYVLKSVGRGENTNGLLGGGRVRQRRKTSIRRLRAIYGRKITRKRMWRR